MQPGKLGARPWCFTAAWLAALTVGSVVTAGQTVTGTPQETNERIREMSFAARITPHDYIIGSGDTLTVDVFDVKELSRDVRVSQTGTIGLPLVPVRLHVKGLTETQAEQKIAEVLQANGLVSHPEVSVAVKDRKSKPITVVGAVAHPLVYQAERPTTLLEVLAEAGGIANDAGDTAIVTRPSADPNDKEDPADAPPISNEDVIPAPLQKETLPVTGSAPAAPVSSQAPISAATANTRPDSITGTKDVPPPTEAPALSNTITVNLNELMETGDAANNIILQSGDIVTVPHAGIVYVLGAITKPGGYVLANDRTHMTTLKMLALAGGFNRTAKSDKAVIIRRDRQGQQHEQIVNLKEIMQRKAEDVRLDPSDILYVPDSRTKQILYRATEAAVGIASGIALYRVAYR